MWLLPACLLLRTANDSRMFTLLPACLLLMACFPPKFCLHSRLSSGCPAVARPRKSTANDSPMFIGHFAVFPGFGPVFHPTLRRDDFRANSAARRLSRSGRADHGYRHLHRPSQPEPQTLHLDRPRLRYLGESQTRPPNPEYTSICLTSCYVAPTRMFTAQNRE